jgi:hypothetical protein
VSDEPATVLGALQLLAAEGFADSFSLGANGIRCGACGTTHVVDSVEVARVFRFEGPSDPEEEAVVYAARCPVCRAGGTVVSSFGPGADPELADRLVMLEARFESRSDPPNGGRR